VAQRVLARVLCNGLKDIRQDAFYLFTLSELAELSFAEGNREVAELLYEEMRHYEGHFAVVSWGVACNGAIDHYLGMLAATLDRWSEAETHFDSALLMNRRLGSRPFVARTQHAYANMLVRTGRQRDGERVGGLLRDAMEWYERLGMKGYLREAEVLIQNVQNSGGGSTMWAGGDYVGGAHVRERISKGAGEVVARKGSALVGEEGPKIVGFVNDSERGRGYVFRREGDYWTLIFEGKVSRFKDKRGLQYLAYLLANPFKQVHSMDLASGVGGTRGETSSQAPAQKSVMEGLRQSRLGDVGPALDARARSDYRRRLAELREELEEAEAFNDLGRVAILRRELEELTSYLTAACRPGRGARLAGSYSERARVSVRNNIASAVRAIRGHDDALGRHLSNAVRTGTFCSYTPERKIRWDF
jgi:hypothetical protein